MVHFVGAGPGATDLITVRGLKFIQNADVIIYAGSLVNPALLDEASKSCEIYNSANMTLQQVIDVMVAAEEQGKTTVRLHTGDPSIYGAIREQMDELDVLGISYDVCPGVSALFGAAASLHCEYTLPDISQTVIISRAEGRTPVPEKEQLKSLASHKATLVLYLSAGLSKKVRDELIAGGYAPETSVAVVYKATWPEEKIYRTTLQELPAMMEKEQVTKTALIIVGDVVSSTVKSDADTDIEVAGESAEMTDNEDANAKKVVYSKSKLYDPTFATEYRATSAMKFPRNIKNVLIIACSKNAYVTAQKLWKKIKDFTEDVCVNLKVKCSSIEDLPLEYKLETSVSECVAENFDKMDAIIFVSASGIAVRAIAPLLTHKSKDPAILCMDELGKHVISLVSGHAGGANELARVIAGQIGATEVITTATDTEGKFSVDDYARKNNLAVTDWNLAKKISVAVLEGKMPEIFSEVQDAIEYHKANTDNENVSSSKIDHENDSSVKKNYSVLISNEVYENLPSGCLQLVPKNLILGIGCKKDIPKEKIASAVKEVFEKHGLHLAAVAGIGSIDLKKEEPGLVEFCLDLKVPFEVFDADTLLQIDGDFSSSKFVQNVTGVDCVCERSAVAFARDIQKQYAYELLVARKYAKDGVTVAVAQIDVCLDVQDFTM